MSEEITSVQIATPADLRDIAGRFGITCSAGKGRLPTSKLRKALAAANVEIIGTDYFPASVTYAPLARPGTAEFVATVEHTETKKVFKEGINSKGKKYRVPTNKTETVTSQQEVRLTAAQIRAITGKGDQRGRLGHSDLRSAFERHFSAVVVDLPTRANDVPTAITAAIA